MRKFPLAIDNAERDVFVGRPGAEVEQHGVVVSRLLDNLVRRSLRFVDKVRIEDVELGAMSASSLH